MLSIYGDSIRDWGHHCVCSMSAVHSGIILLMVCFFINLLKKFYVSWWMMGFRCTLCSDTVCLEAFSSTSRQLRVHTHYATCTVTQAFRLRNLERARREQQAVRKQLLPAQYFNMFQDCMHSKGSPIWLLTMTTTRHLTLIKVYNFWWIFL